MFIKRIQAFPLYMLNSIRGVSSLLSISASFIKSYGLRAFVGKVKNHVLKRPPILLFQISKVGSTSLANTLTDMKLGVPIFHTHILNNLDAIYEDILKRNPNARDALSAVEQGKLVRKKIDSGGYKTWNVISIVRDPVARSISAFFQGLHETAPDVSKRIDTDLVSAEELLEIFLERRIFNTGEWWFESQLKPVFNFDIFAVPFDKEQGYKIYEESWFRLLMMRLENMNENIQPAMKQFLGIQKFNLVRHNVGEEKSYGKVYNAFLKLPLPPAYVTKMYSTRTATHFYKEEERERFIEYWTNK